MLANEGGYDPLKARLRKVKEGRGKEAVFDEDRVSAVGFPEFVERYRYLEAVLEAAHRINQLILKEPNLHRVLAETCSILAGFKGVGGAWIAVSREPNEFIVRAQSPVICNGRRQDIIGTRLAASENRCVAKALESESGSCSKVEDPDCDSCPLFRICRPHKVFICRLEYTGQVRGLLGAFISSSSDGLGVDLGEILPQISQDVALVLFRSDLEQALDESRRHYRHVVKTSLDGFVMFNMEGRFIDANPAFLRLAGYDEDDIKHLGWKDIVPEDSHETSRKMIRHLFRRGYTPLWEQELRTKDGTLRTVESRAYLRRNKDGISMSTWAFVRDITDRKAAERERVKLERQLQQAQRMEAIGTLAGGIAHDFNNILSAVIGYSELALDELQPGTRVHKDIRQVLRAGVRARDLVKQILTFSRQDDEELHPLYPVPLVKEALKLLRSSLPSSIAIRHNIDPNTDNILGYSTQLYQVVINLCTNAAQSMESHEQGVLTVALTSVDLDDDFVRFYPDVSPGRFVRLTVTDTGCGMTPEVADRIFEPYFTTKPKDEGTGLGLAVVHGIVKKANGFIRVLSAPGEGSTFEVYFPAAPKHAMAAQDETVKIPGGKERILLVDDEPFLVNMLSQQLHRAGYQVVGRTSSIEALKLFENDVDRFDLVITDMTMPHLSGEQLTKKLLALRPDLPIILCTGYSRRMTREKADALGIKEFLMKPIVFQELAAAIRKVLEDPAESKTADSTTERGSL